MARRGQPTYGTTAAAQEVGISLRQFYYWVQVLHVVRPRVEQHGRRRFAHLTITEVNTLKTVKRLIEHGHTLQAAVHNVRTHEKP